ncbi:hypothetical protein BPUN_2606 [Candidatus Paraburkholderia kirkii]|nr:hypothetical protein BPUN_2606 [Candidatus Paraburkholderia kirkii]
MAFIIWSRRTMSRQRIRFVEARTARAIAIVGGAALLIAALALDIAIGTVFARSHLGEEQALVSRRSYEMEELGRLNAALIELRPRVEALAGNVEELRDFDVHLKAAHGAGGASNVHNVPPLPDSEEPATALDGAGGPALPPRLCENARRRRAPSAPEEHAADHRLPERRRVGAANPHARALHGLYGVSRPRPFAGRAQRLALRQSIRSVHRPPELSSRNRSRRAHRFPYPRERRRPRRAGRRAQRLWHAIDIRHSDGMVTRYGHASRIFVHAGDFVMPGQEIAEVGSTGRSTGPHLHFEVIVGGAQINPSPYLALFKRRPNAQG